MTEQEQTISKLVRLVTKEASKQNIPLVGDFDYSGTGHINAKFMHYDRLLDLSLPEVMFLEQIVRVVAKRNDIIIGHAGTLRYEVLPDRLRSLPSLQREAEQLEQERLYADRYIKTCRPHFEKCQPVEELIAEWRYLNWPIHCNCSKG